MDRSQMEILPEKEALTEQDRMDGQTDGPTDGRTDGQKRKPELGPDSTQN